MNSKRFLIKLQFLGFRYHGVQKQPDHLSVQGRIEATLEKNIGTSHFQTRFSSRTDAMVSAEEVYCLLMFEHPVAEQLIVQAMMALPPDMRGLEVRPVEENFTMQKHTGEKEYRYFFSTNQKNIHPFSAPFMTGLHEDLDIGLMKTGARVFMGKHYFKNYAYKPKADGVFLRTITKSEIVENTFLQANFFPVQSFVFCVSSRGFMRGQVRLMMGALFRLGKGEMTLEDLEKSLQQEDPSFIKWMAPPAGLFLHSTQLE